MVGHFEGGGVVKKGRGSLVPRLSSLVGKIREGRPGKTYHMTDVTDCGQFQERGEHLRILNMQTLAYLNWYTCITPRAGS